ncbi:MAG: hypothetical protein GC161_03615 [Planctomycetaceae bacterium]|nr:hypothetical protein [Planctomycetaceae bacterium]
MTNHFRRACTRDQATGPAIGRGSLLRASRRGSMGPGTGGLAAGGLLLMLAACGGSPDADLSDQAPGQLGKPSQKPGGGFYLVDPHSGGQSPDFALVGASWGRLVDIWDFDSQLDESSEVYRDIVIGQDVRTEPGKWTLETNPVTGVVRLTILSANTDDPADVFDLRVEEARSNLSPVQPKGVQPGELPPFPLIARNSTLELRFNDLIDASTILPDDTIRLLVGNPPTQPFSARIVPSSVFGGLTSGGGSFQSTRILVDLTVSEFEVEGLASAVPLNGLGLPASNSPTIANVAVRIPSVASASVGQFQLLRNLNGAPLSIQDSGPVDTTSPTLDVVRALRSGGTIDPNNGFLLDLEAPRILSQQGVNIISANQVAGTDEFVLSLSFDTPACAFNPIPGDVIRINNQLVLEATQAASANPAGVVSGLRVTQIGLEGASASSLIGSATYLTGFRSELTALGKGNCFVRFSPAAKAAPTTQVPPTAGVVLRFSEPMDPASVRAFDSMRVLRVPSGTVGIKDYVVAEIFATGDLREFRFQPSLPFEHQNNEQPYYLNLVAGAQRLTDLAGNTVAAVPPQVEFRIEPTGTAVNSKGFVLRFNSANLDEVAPNLTPAQRDVRGQFLYDTGGFLRPRSPARFPGVADRSQALLGVMAPVAGGVVTPLSALGSKLQHIWRYADFGYVVNNDDASLLDLDVEGTALAPLSGQVVAANYPQFEIRLAHSRFLPDEIVDMTSLLPTAANSGLRGSADPFTTNIFQDPSMTTAQLEGTVVHERSKGFFVSQSDVFQNPNGVPMMRTPLNKGLVTDAEKSFYTWRDTSLIARGGLAPSGLDHTPSLPFEQEIGVVFGGTAPAGAPFLGSGGFPQANQPFGPTGLPSAGLPLLMEYRCYPAETSSLNVFDISIAVTSSSLPAFRAFSTGGIAAGQVVVQKNPDTQPNPTGGFQATPGGQVPQFAPTFANECTVYMGQADFVLRVSRVFTRVIDVAQGARYRALVVEPRPEAQPTGTSLQFAWRGLNGGTLLNAARNADNMDVYGNVYRELNAQGGSAVQTYQALQNQAWINGFQNLSQFGPIQFLQTRVTFISNTQTQLSPRLDSYALAYTTN